MNENSVIFFFPVFEDMDLNINSRRDSLVQDLSFTRKPGISPATNVIDSQRCGGMNDFKGFSLILSFNFISFLIYPTTTLLWLIS